MSYSQDVWIKGNAPSNLHYKWDYYFKFLSDKVRNQIQMDEVATHSVSDMRSADSVSDLIRLNLGRMPTTILDAFACVGGNTISFCKKFPPAIITAFEINSIRFSMLQHNLQLLSDHGLFSLQNLQLLNENFVEKLSTELSPDLEIEETNNSNRLGFYDAVFLDPPWGGPDVLSLPKVSISVGGLHLAEICRLLCSRTSVMVLKLPPNFDLEEFHKLFYQTESTSTSEMQGKETTTPSSEITEGREGEGTARSQPDQVSEDQVSEESKTEPENGPTDLEVKGEEEEPPIPLDTIPFPSPPASLPPPSSVVTDSPLPPPLPPAISGVVEALREREEETIQTQPLTPSPATPSPPTPSIPQDFVIEEIRTIRKVLTLVIKHRQLRATNAPTNDPEKRSRESEGEREREGREGGGFDESKNRKFSSPSSLDGESRDRERDRGDRDRFLSQYSREDRGIGIGGGGGGRGGGGRGGEWGGVGGEGDWSRHYQQYRHEREERGRGNGQGDGQGYGQNGFSNERGRDRGRERERERDRDHRSFHNRNR